MAGREEEEKDAEEEAVKNERSQRLFFCCVGVCAGKNLWQNS